MIGLLAQAPKKRGQAVGVGRIADEELHSVVVPIDPLAPPRPRRPPDAGGTVPWGFGLGVEKG